MVMISFAIFINIDANCVQRYDNSTK
jgi:hypothetical protein